MADSIEQARQAEMARQAAWIKANYTDANPLLLTPEIAGAKLPSVSLMPLDLRSGHPEENASAAFRNFVAVMQVSESGQPADEATYRRTWDQVLELGATPRLAPTFLQENVEVIAAREAFLVALGEASPSFRQRLHNNQASLGLLKGLDGEESDFYKNMAAQQHERSLNIMYTVYVSDRDGSETMEGMLAAEPAAAHLVMATQIAIAEHLAVQPWFPQQTSQQQ